MVLEMKLAVCKGLCDRCHEDEWLFIPDHPGYGLLCGGCMQELELSVDQEETERQI